jgi:hypothetical protein
MIKVFKSFMVFLCMLALVLPGIEKAFKIIPVDQFKLVKVPEAMELPSLTFTNFIQNTYQDTVSAWFNYTTGFRPVLVRLRNQIDYSLFHLSHGKIVRGKGDYLFLDECFTACLGWQVDSGLLRRKVDTLEMVKNHLNALGIPMLYVVAPGKGDYDEDAFPAGYRSMKNDITYYDLIQQQLKSHGIEYINLHAYFDRPGAVFAHPVFSKQGLHWSTFGGCLALDTTYRKIAAVLSFEPMAIDLSHDTISTDLRNPEDDLAEMVNLLSVPHVDTLAYPQTICTALHAEKTKKPKVLFVGDSFSYIFGFSKLPTQLFDPGTRFWFNMRVEKNFADITPDGRDLSKVDIENELKQYDMVIILSTDGRYHYGDYGLYRMLQNKPVAVN